MVKTDKLWKVCLRETGNSKFLFNSLHCWLVTANVMNCWKSYGAYTKASNNDRVHVMCNSTMRMETCPSLHFTTECNLISQLNIFCKSESISYINMVSLKVCTIHCVEKTILLSISSISDLKLINTAMICRILLQTWLFNTKVLKLCNTR